VNSLTVGLAILGGLVLAGVVAHSAWQTRRNAPRIAQPDESQKSLAQQSENAPIEPSLDLNGLRVSNDPNGDSELIDLGEASSVTKYPALDALIDAIAPIAIDEPISGDAALAALPPTRRVGSKTFAVEGLSQSEQWEAPRAGELYSAFQAGVQLASRTGALNEIEFSEFVQKAQSFADAVSGSAQFPEMRDEIAKGRELDQFASTHDAQLGFTLRAKSVAWSTGYVQQHAARQGFVAGSFAGRMVLPASGAGLSPILSLNFDTQAALAEESEQTALRHIDLALDVPHVARSEQPYLRMRDVAIALAAAMDGVITDQEGRIISREAMDAIGADLEQLYDTLESRDLAAGSALARRLFS
jgi:hypothetical protein